ncbi:MAG TPA: efflux RND transporter periplasmic adaptor subunit [Bacteroidales bacterium]|nr:efflux RND transporter periplasmic adaptor subunit [Bacteroidales bacterium]HOK99250.1 efflux RND transporter periplasmic adaptor subunit [Bacteroidales bacterium]HPO66155.1 efflux RND transporter periplasmic adaptor subunit [Bacteroidales bacterium]
MNKKLMRKVNWGMIALMALLIACGKTDKQAELAKLRKQQAELAEKIKQLETQIAADTTIKKTPKGTRVVVSEIKPTSFFHSIEVQGKVDGDNSVNVFCEGAGGIVEEIYVTEGQYVKKGQVLAKLDDAIYQTQLKTALSSLEYVTTLYNKQKALWEQKIGSEVQYLNLKNQKESLEGQVATLKEQISKCRIVSPIAGTVEDIPIKKGQMISPAVVSFRVIDLSSLKIVADVSESYSTRIKVGDKVTVFLPDLNKEITGKVDFCSRYINPVNRTFNVTLRIPSNDPAIKANMIAVLRIVDYQNPNAIVVPVNVVQTDQKGKYILVAERIDDSYVARKKYVEPGETYKGITEIRSGLKEGDKVITIGFQELEEGQYVNF